MSRETPKWLNAEFLQKILNKSENDDSIEVNRVRKNSEDEFGQYYLSDIVRIHVDCTRVKSGQRVTESRSVIIKLAPSSERNKELVLEFGVFANEIKMMDTTLERMNDMWKEDGFRLNARVLHTEMGESPFLVLEDLTSIGYRLANAQAGLDFEHSLLVMRRFAMFHGTSVALWEKDPDLLTSYNKGVYHHDNPDTIKELFKDCFKVLGQQIPTWPTAGPSDRDAAEKLLKLLPVCFDKAVPLCMPKSGDFCVLNHGDAWANNQLFRYNEHGRVVDAIFASVITINVEEAQLALKSQDERVGTTDVIRIVALCPISLLFQVDFQLCVWCSPALDLLHFINTSVTEEVELNHVDELFKEYLKTLTRVMAKLGCRTRPPSATELKRALEKFEYTGVMSSVAGFALILLDKSEIKKFDEILEEGEGYVSPVYKNEMFRRRMLRRIATWNNRGLLDV